MGVTEAQSLHFLPPSLGRGQERGFPCWQRALILSEGWRGGRESHNKNQAVEPSEGGGADERIPPWDSAFCASLCLFYSLSAGLAGPRQWLAETTSFEGLTLWDRERMGLLAWFLGALPEMGENKFEPDFGGPEFVLGHVF